MNTFNHLSKSKQIILNNSFKTEDNSLIAQLRRVFTNGPVGRGSIPGRVIAKTQKMVLDILLNTQHYKIRIKGKVEHLGKGVAPYPTPQGSSNWKGSFQVTLD